MGNAKNRLTRFAIFLPGRITSIHQSRHDPVVMRAENAALLATFMLLKAQALDQLGRADEAQAVRLDSLGWARYGFGSEGNVRARMNDIAALSPFGIGG